MMQGISENNQLPDLQSRQLAHQKLAVQDYDDIDVTMFRSKELEAKIKKVSEKFKPNIDRIIA